MTGKRKMQQRKRLVLSKVKTEQMRGRDKTMLQKKTEHWQEVKSK